MVRSPWFLRRRTVQVAVKAAIACGLAFWLGSLLPTPLDDYAYYAALGAFTVVGLVLVDSVKESLQVFGAVAIGVAVALAAQSISWANSVTVAVTIAVCYLLGTRRLFGVQRTWAPLAGLFVLAAGGADPEPLALGYLVQLPLGALVGVAVNGLLLAPLGDDDLEPASRQTIQVLAGQMRSYADLLQEQREATDDTEGAAEREDLIHANVVAMEDAQARLRSAIVEARRAVRGNPRARRHERAHAAALERAEAVNRCSATLLSVGVLLGQSAPPRGEPGRAMRRHTEETLRLAAEVFEQPHRVREQPDLLRRTLRSVETLLDLTRSADSSDDLDGVFFTALALAIRDCLETFARHVADVDLPDPEGA